VRKNPDPVVNPSVSPYAVFNNNPIHNVDRKGDVVAPWWLRNTSGKVYPGSEPWGGFVSPYKNFVSAQGLNNFNSTVVELYNSNDIFRATADRLQASKQVYHVKELYKTSLSAGASYSPKTNTVNLFYGNGFSNAEVFEEVFHAGQDDYYGEKGISRSGLANEVEAKAANLLSGFKDVTLKRDYGAIKEYFKTGKQGKGFDKEVDALIEDVYSEYSKARGGEWAEKNKPETVDKSKVFNYLESVKSVGDTKQ
jgi:hypothetical protein